MATGERSVVTPVARAVRVLIVDDSALMRKLLTAILGSDPEIEVVGTARDPYDAREKIKALAPDVLTLDVEMPRMDGITFLAQLMRLRPMPVVMVSSLTERSADVTLAALELGAFDFVPKPKIDIEAGLEAARQVLIDKVKAAAGARMLIGARVNRPPAAAAAAKLPATGLLRTTERLIAIGASTGGTEAIADVLAQVPPDAPGIVIVQHIPEVFSARFAARLDAHSALAVSEARDGDQILIGHAYVAPGNHHLRVERSGARYHCRVTSEEPVNRHRPSVDVLFRSVAAEAGANAVGVLLTGMGADGAEGLLEMLRAGSPTIAQDQETCVVFGMPKEAIKRGAAAHVCALPGVAAKMLELARAAVR